MSEPATFAPAPGAAPLPRMVLAQASMEARLLLRNGEQVLIALVIPLVVLIAGVSTSVVDLGPGRRVDVLLPGVIALAVLSTGFTSVAIATGYERRYGVLKRLGVSPLPRWGLLAGKALAILAVELAQLIVIIGAGLALGWRPTGWAGMVAPALIVVLLGSVTFTSLGLLLAGTLRAEATLAVANLGYLLFLVAGAVVIPLAEYPDAVAAVMRCLPSAALAEGLRAVLANGPFPWWAPGVLLGWGVVGCIATARTFRWE